MQSAIDACVHVVEIVKGESWNSSSPSIQNATNYLRARDKEIVNMCKDKVLTYVMQKVPGISGYYISLVTDALDSVLRDLG